MHFISFDGTCLWRPKSSTFHDCWSTPWACTTCTPRGQGANTRAQADSLRRNRQVPPRSIQFPRRRGHVATRIRLLLTPGHVVHSGCLTTRRGDKRSRSHQNTGCLSRPHPPASIICTTSMRGTSGGHHRHTTNLRRRRGAMANLRDVVRRTAQRCKAHGLGTGCIASHTQCP